MPKCSAIWGIAFGVMTLASAGQAQAACSIAQIAEIPVVMKGLSPVVEGKVNDQPVTIIADTGATLSMMVTSAAERIGLKPKMAPGLKFYGAGGETQGYIVHIDKLTLGRFSSSKGADLVVMGRSTPINNSGVDMLLGADFFSQADVEFDLANGVIRLMRPTDCKEGEVVYWGGNFAVEKLIARSDAQGGVSDHVVEVEVNGRKVQALLDTGASTSVMDDDFARRIGVKVDESGPASDAIGIGGNVIKHRRAQLDSFAFDQEQIRNPFIRVADMYDPSYVSTGSRMRKDVLEVPQILLGADFFLAHRIFFARSERKVYITYNGGPVFQDIERTAKPVPATAAPE